MGIYGNMGIWDYGNMGIWEYGSSPTNRFLSIYRPQKAALQIGVRILITSPQKVKVKVKVGTIS
jgi:hypothetical protein